MATTEIRARAARYFCARASLALAARQRRLFREALDDVVLALWRDGAEVVTPRAPGPEATR